MEQHGWGLNDWLAWQERLHPRSIDLGLERCQRVIPAMAWPSALPFPVISVAGTNGKGSSVAMLEAIFGAAGFRTGAYTSPHLLHYNERIRIAGTPASDETLIAAFEKLESARADTSLSYFEFGTLAAMEIFLDEGVDAAILEVGLGGRLDAVNLFPADVALVTNIALDHTEWLGADREAIGREKAGIFRRHHPAVVGEASPPASLGQYAQQIGAPLYRLGQEYKYRRSGPTRWSWQGPDRDLEDLPLPALSGEFQLDNAAAVLMVLDRLAPQLPVSPKVMRQGLTGIQLPGRFQVLKSASIECIVDVAHNPAAATVLAKNLGQRACKGRTLAVVGMLADKAISEVLSIMTPVIDSWYLGGIEAPRGANSEMLVAALGTVDTDKLCRPVASVEMAYQVALADAGPNDRIIAFGSFLTVGTILQLAS